MTWYDVRHAPRAPADALIFCAAERRWSFVGRIRPAACVRPLDQLTLIAPNAVPHARPVPSRPRCTSRYDLATRLPSCMFNIPKSTFLTKLVTPIWSCAGPLRVAHRTTGFRGGASGHIETPGCVVARFHR